MHSSSNQVRTSFHSGWGLTLAACLIVGLSTSSEAWGHPFHISTAELEFNPQTGRIEVALKLHAADLDRAISVQQGERFQIEKDENSEAIARYLNGHFRLLSMQKDAAKEAPNSGDDRASSGSTASKAKGKSSRGDQDKVQQYSKVRMVGSELETSWVWLYFEMELEPSKWNPREDRLLLENTVLLGLIDKQINTATIRLQGKRKSLKFTSKTPRIDLDSVGLDSEWFTRSVSATAEAK